MIPNLSEINIKDLKKEIFSLLLLIDDNYLEEALDYRLFYHNMCAIKQKGSDALEAYELLDCSREKRLPISNKFLLYKIKEQIEIDISEKDATNTKEIVLPS